MTPQGAIQRIGVLEGRIGRASIMDVSAVPVVDRRPQGSLSDGNADSLMIASFRLGDQREAG